MKKPDEKDHQKVIVTGKIKNKMNHEKTG